VQALIDFGTPDRPDREGVIFFFGDTPPDFDDFGGVDVRPELRFTIFDEQGSFDPDQQEVAWDPNEYIHLTVTDQWEVYEHFYGQGHNKEIIRYLDGFVKVLDKHIDTGQPGQLWVIPYVIESQECRKLDSLSRCSVDPIDVINKAGDDSNNSGQQSDSTYLEKPRLSEQLAQSQGGNSWYVNLLNKLKD